MELRKKMQRSQTAYKKHSEFEKTKASLNETEVQSFEDVCSFLLNSEEQGAKNLQVLEGTILVNNIFTGKTSNSGEPACSTLLRNTKATGEILPDGKSKLIVVDAKINFYGAAHNQFKKMIDNLPNDCTKIRVRILGENMNRQVREAENRIALEIRVFSFVVKKRYLPQKQSTVEVVSSKP